MGRRRGRPRRRRPSERAPLWGADGADPDPSGTGHGSRRSGPCRRRRSIRPTRDTSSSRRYLHVFGPGRPRRSPSGRGSAAPAHAAFAALGSRSYPSARRSATAGSSPRTKRRSVPRDPRARRRGSSRAATRSSCSRVPTASSSSPTRTGGRCSGRRAYGPAPSWSRARSSARGGASQAVVTVEPWQKLSAAQRHAVEEEAASMPLPGDRRGTSSGFAGRSAVAARFAVHPSPTVATRIRRSSVSPSMAALAGGRLAWANELNGGGRCVYRPALNSAVLPWLA